MRPPAAAVDDDLVPRLPLAGEMTCLGDGHRAAVGRRGSPCSRPAIPSFLDRVPVGAECSGWPLESWPAISRESYARREDRLCLWGFQERIVGDRLGLDFDEIASGHLPMLSRPAELAQRLVELTC